MSYALFNYNADLYRFRSVIDNLFYHHIPNPGPDWEWHLEKIHLYLQDKYSLFTEVGKDSVTSLHKLYYNHCGVSTRFHDIYLEFINTEVNTIFTSHNIFNKKHGSQKFLYQKIPTFRVHLPGNVAVAAFHKDRDYNHSPWETNFSIPITDCFGNNAIWIESEEDKGDYAPMEVNWNQFVVFDGANYKHGNQINDTDHTRISIDFRVLPLEKYVENDKTSVAVNTKMTIGDYWLLYDNN